MSEFLNRWRGRGFKADWRRLSRRTIKTDRWDEQDLERTFDIMPDFGKARDRFCDNVDTGNGATADTWMSFFKHDPLPMPAEEVRPDYLINAYVRDELQDMTEFEELRNLGTVGDDVNSALAFITMKDDLETIFDKVKTESELAKKLQQQLQDLQAAEAESKTADEMLEEMQADPDADEDALAAAQKAAQDAQDALDQAEQDVNNTADQIQEGLDGKKGQIQHHLRKGLEKARDEARTLDGVDQTWGTEPGSLVRLSAEKRMELAKKIKDKPKLKRLAELLGPMKRVMFGEQRKKAEHARDEVFNVEKGSDLSRLVPEELVYMHHPRLRKLFYRNLADNALLQYELKGEERVGLGGIICAIDNSGSMSGDREIWAKAVGLSLLNLAKAQKRSFKGIHFGYATEIAEFDFLRPEDFSLEKIFDFAELFFGGGTDFQAPLTVAVKHLQEEFDKYGKIRGDIVFITDGECGVQDEWLEDFKRTQEDLGFQVFGVLIGNDFGGRMETLSKICDGKVVSIRSLTSPDDVRDIFGKIHSF